MLAQVELAKGQLHLGEAETSTVPTTSTATSTRRPRKKSRFDSDLLLRYSKPRHCTFCTFCHVMNSAQKLTLPPHPYRSNV